MSSGEFPIVVQGLTKRYGRARQVWALRDVSLTIQPGIFGLLGRNGAGKTTLLQILATLLAPTSGSAKIGPYDTRRQRWEIRPHLGYLPQEHGFYPALTVTETLRYFAALQNLAQPTMAIGRALEAVNLGEKAQARVAALSGGMRRRLGLAQALLGDPAVLIVDEPTAGLDPVEQQRFRTLLGTLGADGRRTVILSTHVVADIASAARRVAVLERGRLAFDGGVSELRARAQGQTWEWRATLTQVEAARVNPDVIVTAVTPTEQTAHDGTPLVIARAVGAQPAPDASGREPTLEDGYFMLLGKDAADVAN